MQHSNGRRRGRHRKNSLNNWVVITDKDALVNRAFLTNPGGGSAIEHLLHELVVLKATM